MARSLDGTPYLSLDEYRRIMHVPTCVFNGVENPDEAVSGCDKVFMQWQRDEIAQSLADAEGLLADRLLYWPGMHYLTNLSEPWKDPMCLNYGHITGAGIEGLTEVTPSASDFTTDPATITVAQADFPGGSSEIKIVETLTDLVINPSLVTEVGTDYVIYIPQCSLIEWDNLENQAAIIDYDDTFPAATWLKLADLTVYRSYLDTDTQAVITFGPACSCYAATCEETDVSGCVYVMNPEISKVRVQLTDYSVYCGCYSGDKVKVYYQTEHYPPNWKRAVVSLANSMLDFPPCGCSAFDYRMTRDRNIPAVLTGSRIDCPWGLFDGAWFAWKWAQVNKHVSAFMAG